MNPMKTPARRKAAVTRARATARGVAAALGMSAIAGVLAVSGCGPGATEDGKHAAVELPLIHQDTAQEAAQTLVALCRAELKAIAAADRPTAKRAGELLMSLADTAQIEAQFKTHWQYKTILGDDYVRAFVENWPATISYYVEAVDLGSAHAAAGDGRRQIVFLTSPAPREATIRVECSIGADKLWRVAQVAFEPPAAATRPAPASGP
ncbi:MAG: hypothetical protein U1D55_19060 [Phycisphaerae bacterium]